MTQQLSFFLFLKLFGWISFRDLFPREMVCLSIVCSFFLGTTSFVILFLFSSLIFNICGQTVTGAFWTSTAILMAVTLIRSKAPSAVSALELSLFIISLAVHASVIVLTSQYNLTQGTYDSFTYMQMGEIIGSDGFFAVPGSLYAVRSIFYPMFHSLSVIFDIEYLWSFIVVYAIEFIGAFSLLTFMAANTVSLSKHIISALTILGTTLLFSSFMIIYNCFYINHHMITAAHFTLFFLLAWHGIDKRDNRLIIIALVILSPSIMMRVENTIYLLIMTTLLSRHEFLGRHMVSAINFIVGCTVTIYSLLLYYLLRGGDGGFVSPDRMIPMALAGGSMMSFGLVSRWQRFFAIFDRFRIHVDLLLVSALTSIVIFIMFQNFDKIGHSIIVSFANMLECGHWDGLWFGIICLMVLLLTLRMRPIAGEAFLLSSVTSFLLILVVLLLPYSGPYHSGFFDSANRMLIHIVPTIIFYLIVKFAANSHGRVSAVVPREEIFVNKQ